LAEVGTGAIDAFTSSAVGMVYCAPSSGVTTRDRAAKWSGTDNRHVKAANTREATIRCTQRVVVAGDICVDATHGSLTSVASAKVAVVTRDRGVLTDAGHAAVGGTSKEISQNVLRAIIAHNRFMDAGSTLTVVSCTKASIITGDVVVKASSRGTPSNLAQIERGAVFVFATSA
jgi:hypothetical protein